MIEADHLCRIAHWARSLEPFAFERVQAEIVERQYPAGTTICEYGERFDYWAGVSTGLLKMRALSSEGKEVTLAGIHAGAWFGEGTLLKKEARQYDIVALRQTTLALLDLETFLWLFENSAAFPRYLVVQINERLGQFIAQVEIDRRLDTTARVARALALLVNPTLYPDAGDYLDLTQEELGQLAGVSRPTANQAIKQLQELGMNGTAVKEASNIRFPMDRFIGNWWSGGNDAVIPAGKASVGYKSATFHGVGTSFDAYKDIEAMYAAGLGASKDVAEHNNPLWARGIANAAYVVEAIRTGQAKYGNRQITGEEMRWALENLDLTDARIAEIGMEWDGEPIAEEPADHRARLHYLAHAEAIKPALTVAEDLAFWQALNGSASAVNGAIEALGLQDRSSIPCRYLSAGQRRRLALARLLVSDTDLWLLDEPSVGLDTASLGRLREAIADHRAGGGMVIAATHGRRPRFPAGGEPGRPGRMDAARPILQRPEQTGRRAGSLAEGKRRFPRGHHGSPASGACHGHRRGRVRGRT